MIIFKISQFHLVPQSQKVHALMNNNNFMILWSWNEIVDESQNFLLVGK